MAALHYRAFCGNSVSALKENSAIGREAFLSRRSKERQCLQKSSSQMNQVAGMCVIVSVFQVTGCSAPPYVL